MENTFTFSSIISKQIKQNLAKITEVSSKVIPNVSSRLAPANLMPKLLQLSSNAIPLNMQYTLQSKILNSLFAPMIAEQELDFLQGKWLAIELTDINQCFYLTLEQGLLRSGQPQTTQDVKIAGETNSFALLASQTVDPDTLFFKRQLQITGDTELGLEVKNFLDTVELELFPTLLADFIRYYAADIKTQST